MMDSTDRHDPATVDIVALRALFDQVMDQPAPERASWLRLNVGDSLLRARLERLIAADAADGALDLAAAARAQQLDLAPDLPAADLIGQSFAGFKLISLLGQGGMATVFLAERDTADFHQRAAVKLLRRGLYSELEQSLFRRERRALAALSHPNIARLIDGGVTSAGIPFLVLEYVDGMPITQWASERRLGLSMRLRLVVDVCRAVAAAHRALIVHRDLKPSNIMVDREGQVKLLDFGIAKLLAEGEVGDEASRTARGILTPGYAAPEQMTGGEISTATDVYALGVILHELLLGERPIGDTSERPSDRLSRRAEDAEISTPMPAMRLRAALRGDLDNVLLKALADDPALRYPDAAALSEDLESFLESRPVRAHPPSGWYRARKFVSRHRGGVATALMVAMSILAALAIAVWQSTVAQRQAQQARAITEFMVGMFRAAEDRLPRNQRPTLDDLIETARGKLAAEAGIDDATRAEIELTLGEVSRLSADFGAANTLFDAAAHRLGAVASDDARLVRIRASQAQVLQQQGRSRDALTALLAIAPQLDRQAIELRQDAYATETAAYLSLAQPEQAIAIASKALAVARAALGADHLTSIRAQVRLGAALVTAERFREALEQLDPALLRWRALNLALDREYMSGAESQAIALHAIGETADSLARFGALLQQQRAIYREPHDQIASTMRNYATVLGAAGRIDEAVANHRESIRMLQLIFGEDHEQLVVGHNQLGLTLAGALRLDQAQTEYREAIAICNRAALDGADCARAHNNLGMTYYRQQRFGEARAEMEPALARFRAIFGERHINVSVALTMLSNVAAGERRLDDAIGYCEQSLAIIHAIGMDGSRDEALTRNTCATALWLAGRNDDALREIDNAIQSFDRVSPAQVVRRTQMRILRAQILRDLKRLDESTQTAQDAIALGAEGKALPASSRRILRDLSGRQDLYPGLE